MQSLSLAAGVLLTVLIPASAAGQSLADVARAEEARRRTVKAPSKVYTNDDLRGKDVAPSTTPPPAPKDAAPAAGMPPLPPATGTAAKPPVVATAPVDGRDEKYWRNQIGAARAALQRSQGFLEALQSHINGLTTEFVNMSDPIQRAAIEQKRIEALGEQSRVKADIVAQTKAIAAIEDDARRASVPAGWLR
jgi:hypothetical protein